MFRDYKHIFIQVLAIAIVAMLLVLACETAPNPPEKGDIGNGNTPPTPEKIARCAAGCEDIVDPVCGLDGVIYSNPCIARCTGTEIDPDGDCAVCEKSTEAYQAEGLQKVRALNDYITIILKNGGDEKADLKIDNAIEESLKLFVSENSQVSVSGRDGDRQFAVRDYLDRIRNYAYGRVEIMWTEIGYVSQLKKGTDGNYYGVISITQQFVGYSKDSETPEYIDQTQKDIEIVLKTYTISDHGRVTVDCRILLNDIGVTDTKTFP